MLQLKSNLEPTCTKHDLLVTLCVYQQTTNMSQTKQNMFSVVVHLYHVFSSNDFDHHSYTHTKFSRNIVTQRQTIQPEKVSVQIVNLTKSSVSTWTFVTVM